MTEAEYKNPAPTVDIIIQTRCGDEEAIVLILRKNPPPGWALPGGYVDYGESLEEAAIREAREETSLQVRLIRQFHTYSDPVRDPRGHTISTVFIAEAEGELKAGDDASGAAVFPLSSLPEKIAFDHRLIINDYINKKY